MALSVQAAQRRVLALHRHEIDGSLVYVDDGAAEVLATLGAAIEELGAAAVCDLAAASPADLPTACLLAGGGPVRHVALLVTQLLAQAEGAVLAACRHCSGAAQFTVLMAASEAAHHDESPGLYSPSCFGATAAAWQRQLNAERQAAGHGPCSLAILPCPLLLCPLSSSAFVLPAASAAAGLPWAGGYAAGFSTSAAAADGESNEDEPTPVAGGQGGVAGGGTAPASGIALLAHSLVSLTAALGHRPEAFSLGPCSRLVSRAMGFVPAAGGDLPPAALVLVDRLMDPVSPALHADLLVQRLYDLLAVPPTVLPTAAAAGGGGGGGVAPFSPLCAEVPIPSLDPAVANEAEAAAAAQAAPNLAAAGSGGEGSSRGPGSLLPGSLRHPDDAQAERWLEFLLSRRGRDGPLFVRKWLREAARKENVPQLQLFKPGATISAAELRSLADGLRCQSPAAAYRHAPLLQLAEAAAAAVEGPHAEHWEALQREERQLLCACSESPEAAAAHLSELCRLVAAGGGGGASRPTLSDVALLALAAHCLLSDLQHRPGGSSGGGSTFSPRQEQQLREALVAAVVGAGSGGAGAGSSSSSGGGGDCGSPAVPGGPAWALEQLAARVAAAKQVAAGTAGGPTIGGSRAGKGQQGEELQALQLEAADAVEALLGRMHELAAFRSSLQLRQLGRLAEAGPDGAPRHTPLLRQIAEHVLADQPLPDLHAGATSLSGLLRSGLGRFGLKAGPKPSDCSTVILFVVGGISIAELHDIQQAVDEHIAQQTAAGGSGDSSTGAAGGAATKPPPRILVGGTALLRHGDLCRHMFADL